MESDANRQTKGKYVMKFGNYEAGDGVQKRGVSPYATFTRGTLIAGKQWKFKFGNGFGASIINDGHGHEEGLYELAVLDANNKITYTTPLTNDVLGYLTPDEVGEALAKIEALPASDEPPAEVAKPKPPVTFAETTRAVWTAGALVRRDVKTVLDLHGVTYTENKGLLDSDFIVSGTAAQLAAVTKALAPIVEAGA